MLKKVHAISIYLSAFTLVLLTYPTLLFFNKASLILGIPLLYFYIFLVWIMLIVGVAILVKQAEKNI